MAPPSSTYSAHLLVVLHGLWGSSQHVRYVAQSALEHATASPSQKGGNDKEMRLLVLTPKMNESTLTYDGVDLCAERAIKEIDEEMERIESDGGKVERFSIVGYSLGGLVARYVLGLLDSRAPSFFDSVEPVNFTTFASPWIGIPKYGTFWSNVFRFLGARLLSQSGAQLYERDRFLPSRFNPSSPDYSHSDASTSRQSFFSKFGKRERAEPLLKILADPQFSFYRALAKFERIEVFANAVNDRTVPFPTGALELHDPFALARAKARKAAEERGDDPDAVLDLATGGLDIKLREGAPIVESYETLEKPRIPTTTPPSRRGFNFRLPLLLRPSKYPFSRPISVLVIVLLPVALPLSIVYLVGRFLVQGRSSKRRIRELRKLTAGERGREGMLERVGVKLREVAERVVPDNPEFAEDLSGQANGFETTNAPNGNNYGSTLDQTPATSGTSTPALLRGGLPPTTLSSPSESSSSASSSDPLTSPPTPRQSSHTPNPEARKFSTDPLFSESQLFQLEHLNALPQMRKHFVYLPNSPNSHGAIVRRDPRFEQHRIGTKVIDFWAKEFKL